jgi:pimeloyl-ACP methyl ester carboxylesterase
MAESPRTLTDELRFTQVTSGARIAWARSGRAGAPSLVRVAHWMTHVDFDLHSPITMPLIEKLGRQLQVVRYDERGCGLSTADEEPLGLDASTEELAAVVEDLGASRVALLGASSAAAPAIAYAAGHPERVSHLVLLGGYTHGLLQRENSARAQAFFAALQRVIELGWGLEDADVQAYFSSHFLPDATREELISLTEHQRLSCSGERASAILRARASLDVRALAPQVQVPTLVLHSEGDLAVPVTMGHELTAAIPGARFEALPTRNHLPVPSDPCFERMIETVTEFVLADASGPALTARERELAVLVGQGLDNLQIAASMGLAEKTVRNMLSSLYVKLGVEGRAMAVVKCRDLAR